MARPRAAAIMAVLPDAAPSPAVWPDAEPAALAAARRRVVAGRGGVTCGGCATR